MSVAADIETAKVYGRQAAATMAAIKSFDLEDPAQAVNILYDQAAGIAASMGFDLADAGPGFGIMGKVIKVATDRLRLWIESKKAESDKDRDEQQDAILSAITTKYKGRGKWIVELGEHELEGNGGYYWKKNTVGLAGVLTKRLVPALPLAPGRGALQQGSGAGKPASGVWRFWPGLFPIISNTNELTRTHAIRGRYALQKMLELAAMPLDAAGNLMIDGREVAATVAALKEWARPLFKDDISSGAPILPAGPNMRIPESGEGRRFTYEQPNGLLLVWDLPEVHKPSSPSYSTPFVRWLQTPAGVISMEPDAYNHVLQTCARFFAFRELTLRRANRGKGWDEPLRQIAAKSSEPSVLAALTRRPTRVGRTTTGTTTKPTTTGVHGPTAQPQSKPRPQRVGRLDAWPSIAAIEESIAGTESST